MGTRSVAAVVMSEVTRAFERVYNRSLWGGHGGGSGSGSSEVAAAGAARIVYHCIMLLGVRRMMDAPCGAMVWQKSLLEQLAWDVERPGFRYLGIDAVYSVIDKNRAMFRPTRGGSFANAVADNPGFHVGFKQADLTVNALPRGRCDMLLSRDALQHNRIDGVWRVLHNYAQSNCSHLLIGSYPYGSLGCRYTNGSPNFNTRRTGDFFCIDLRKPPFELVPRSIFREDGSIFRKTLYLYDRDSFRQQLARSYARTVGPAPPIVFDRHLEDTN